MAIKSNVGAAVSDGGCKPGRCYMEDRQLSMQHVPPLHVADGSKGTAGPLQFGTSAAAGAARRKL